MESSNIQTTLQPLWQENVLQGDTTENRYIAGDCSASFGDNAYCK